MTKNRIQVRGNCQLCGSEQAIVRGRMAHHGYTVEHGYFEGKCQGHMNAPLQHDRSLADKVVADVRKQALDLDARVEGLKNGTIRPESVPGKWVGRNAPGARRDGYESLPFDQGSDYAKEQAIKHAIYHAESRARAARTFAHDLEGLANRVHGQPLREVEIVPLPSIEPGERRTAGSYVLTVRYIERGRVYWQRSDGMRSWTGARSWRDLPLATS